tara:strand:- start:1494 stop:2288 length:795 start_codon:yes stop_codon:yes gene_type:complete
MAKTNVKTVRKNKESARELNATGAQATALKALAPIAKEVNIRMEKAAQMEDGAYDHRLAAALQLADASDRCAKAKIKFKEWVDESINQSYETARKLVTIGKSNNPEEALEEMRVKNKLANAALRLRKAIKAPVEKEAVAKTAGKKAPVQTPTIRAMEALKVMPDSEAVNLIKSTAQSHGLEVVSSSEAGTVRDARRYANDSPLVRIRAIFNKCSAEEKCQIVDDLSSEVGNEIGTAAPVNVDDIDMPDFLKVTEPKKSRRRSAN